MKPIKKSIIECDYLVCKELVEQFSFTNDCQINRYILPDNKIKYSVIDKRQYGLITPYIPEPLVSLTSDEVAEIFTNRKNYMVETELREYIYCRLLIDGLENKGYIVSSVTPKITPDEKEAMHYDVYARVTDFNYQKRKHR